MLLEKIKSFNSGLTDSNPTLNLALDLEDNKVNNEFDLKKLISKSYSFEINSKESFPVKFP